MRLSERGTRNDFIADVVQRGHRGHGQFECASRRSHQGVDRVEKGKRVGASADSLDMNPIELSFSKLKLILRKMKIRDVPTLQKFLLESKLSFTKKECNAYFKHDGYLCK
jgi:transposase